MAIRFEDSEWPLLVIRFIGQEDDESITGLLRGLTHYTNRGRCALLIDTTATVYSSLSDATRWGKREGEWLRAHRDVVARNVCGFAFVFTNQAVRLVLSTIFLIAPLPSPHLVTTEVAEGRLWCLTQLRLKPRNALASKQDPLG